MKKRFFIAQVLNPWSELDEENAAVDRVEKFKRKLGEFR